MPKTLFERMSEQPDRESEEFKNLVGYLKEGREVLTSTPSHPFTPDVVIAELKRTIADSGMKATAWGKQNGFSPAFMSLVLNGKKPPSPRLCAVLGFERVVSYRRQILAAVGRV